MGKSVELRCNILNIGKLVFFTYYVIDILGVLNEVIFFRKKCIFIGGITNKMCFYKIFTIVLPITHLIGKMA